MYFIFIYYFLSFFLVSPHCSQNVFFPCTFENHFSIFLREHSQFRIVHCSNVRVNVLYTDSFCSCITHISFTPSLLAWVLNLIKYKKSTQFHLSRIHFLLFVTHFYLCSYFSLPLSLFLFRWIQAPHILYFIAINIWNS